MAARGIKLAPGELVSTVEGDIEKTEHTIKIAEIRVTYRLPMAAEHVETADRALALHTKRCPAHESVKDAIRIVVRAEYR